MSDHGPITAATVRLRKRGLHHRSRTLPPRTRRRTPVPDRTASIGRTVKNYLMGQTGAPGSHGRTPTRPIAGRVSDSGSVARIQALLKVADLLKAAGCSHEERNQSFA
jgi:hypothetical protein